jgi:hypothetical protein
MKKCFGSSIWGILLLATPAIAQRTLYVSPTSTNPTPPYATWDTAAPTIQEAVDAASDGDAVWVAAGEYALTNQVTIAKGILLRSDAGPSRTTLNGQNTVRCLWASNSVAVVDGFTMSWGVSDESGGGGVFLVGATVQNCMISSCYSLRSNVAGGAVVVGGTLSNSIVTGVGRGLEARSAIDCISGGLITDCQITGNGGPNGGIDTAAVYLADSELRNSAISNNYAYTSGGLYGRSSKIVGCSFGSNWAVGGEGGGAHLDQCEVDRCIIVGNRNLGFEYPPGRGGGIFTIGGVIRNSLIAGNRAASATSGPGLGGGIYLRGGSLLNCTVAANRADHGGGIYVESEDGGTSNPVVRNCVVFFNSASSGTNWSWQDPPGSFDHCCTIPSPNAVGDNTVQDPQFIDQPNGNYRLAPTSPCIDAGLNEAWMVGSTDLDGDPRIRNEKVDLGAWESTNAPPQVQAVRFAPLQVDNRSIRSMIGGLPAQGTLIIERSADLVEWQPFRTNTITGDAFEWLEPINPSSPHLFFRALVRH